MTIEVLYPKLCNLFGDSQNMKYFRRCLPDAEFVETEVTDERPAFADRKVDMVYLGSMSEKAQLRALKTLEPYRERIEELIDSGAVFLATGNAWEIFTRTIHNRTTGETAEGLGLFDLTTEIDLFDRYNGKDLGSADGVEIAGFRSQFSMVYGDNSEGYFLSCERGIGINRGSRLEGVRKNNFMGTHLLGPILPVNPPFAEYLMKLLGVEEPKAAFREEAMAAYEQRLREFRNPKLKF